MNKRERRDKKTARFTALQNLNTSALHRSNTPVRIGNQTSFSAPPILPFEYAIENGFDTFEWFPDKRPSGIGWNIDDISPETRLYIRKMAVEHNVSLTIHARWWANPLISENQKVLSEDLKFAIDINATLINIHLYKDNGLENYVKSIMPFIIRSKESGIKLAIENTALTNPDDFNKLFFILQNLKGVRTEHVGMCLDIGHANLCDLARNDYIGFLDQIAPETPIIHVHLHENYGDQDSHLPIFTGPARNNDTGVRALIERLKKRGFSGSIILEQWPQPPSLLNQARDKLYQILFSLA